jgi:4-hydroxy-4-methyl-2-oxoglutarate aldolase
MKKMRLFIFLICGIFLAVFQVNAQNELTDEQILKLYEGLRVADVSDGMDMVGLMDVGLMGTEIEALWKDIDDFSHQFRGIAVTARYVPTNRVVKRPMEADEFRQWEGNWYGQISTEPFVEYLKEGSVVVLDVQGDGDTGSVGSNNGLSWVSKGAVGIVSNGGIRDTDEVIKEKIPVYLDHMNRGRGIRPGRNEIESVQKPVTIGGVLIRPGDVVVADGDGVIVVPRQHAQQVAEYAKGILTSDKEGRRKLYEQLGMPLDETVMPDK